MIVQTVKFKSGLSDEDVLRVMTERAPQFRALSGLVQKYYVRDRATGEVCGLYFWDSEESLGAFRASELARTIPGAYAVTGTPRIETFEVLFPLREEVTASSRQETPVTR